MQISIPDSIVQSIRSPENRLESELLKDLEEDLNYAY
jgi:hypothetical protein